MYSRIVTAQIQPGKLDELSAIFETAVAPEVKQLPGFKSISLLEDRATNQVVIVSTWETEADMKGLEANGIFQEQLAKLALCMSCPPTREWYEVRSMVTSS